MQGRSSAYGFPIFLGRRLHDPVHLDHTMSEASQLSLLESPPFPEETAMGHAILAPGYLGPMLAHIVVVTRLLLHCVR